MNTLSRSLMLAAAAVAIPVASQAGVTITWAQIGTGPAANFRGTLSGSFSAAELAASSTSITATFGAGGSFDTTPSFSIIPTSGSADYVLFNLNQGFTVMPGYPIGMNSYNIPTSQLTGTSTFGFFQGGSTLYLTLASNYVDGSALSGSVTGWCQGFTLSSAFLFGDVYKLNGNPFITFVNGGTIAVPEPSTYGLALGGMALAVVALRRRRK